MATINIKGYEVLVDDEIIPLFKEWRVTIVRVGNSGHKYVSILIGPKGVGKRFALHRYLMGAVKGQEVDHINGNGLDNRGSNLRLCTHHQNMMNKRMARNNTSGIKGVSWVKQHSKWMASIRVNRRTIHLGLFISKEDAGKAYNDAAKLYFGDFNRLS